MATYSPFCKTRSLEEVLADFHGNIALTHTDILILHGCGRSDLVAQYNAELRAEEAARQKYNATLRAQFAGRMAGTITGPL